MTLAMTRDKDRELAENIVETLKAIDEVDQLEPRDPDDYNVEKVLERIKAMKPCRCRKP